MLEKNMCLTLIDQMKKVVKDNELKRIFEVEVEISDKSKIKAESLIYVYPETVKGTEFEDTELVISISKEDILEFQMVRMEVE